MHDVQPLGFMLLETQIEEKNPIYIFYIYTQYMHSRSPTAMASMHCVKP